MIMTKRKPATIGEILFEEFLAPLNLTQGDLAQAMGVPRKHLNELCNDRRTIRLAGCLRDAYAYPSGMRMRNVMRRILTGLLLMLIALPALAQNNRGKRQKDNTISQETLEALTTDYYARGNAYYSKGLYDQAIAAYTKAIKFLPVNADVYFNRGVAYSDKGLYDQAIADYTKVIALKPNDAIAYNQRAWTYHLKGEDAKGLPDANKAIALAPKEVANLETRAEIYEKLRQRDKAVADYRAALKLNPNDMDSQAGLKRLGVMP